MKWHSKSFHSNLPVTPKGGHQRRPVLYPRMGSPSVSPVVMIQNLGTRAMKDETLWGGRWLQLRALLQRTRWFADVRGRFPYIFNFFARSRLLFAVIYNISTCVRLHPKTCGCCIFVVPIANACVKKRVGNEQSSHFPPCFSPMLMVPVRECVTVFSQCEEGKKRDQIVPYAHDYYNQFVLCEAFLRICFSSLCKYTPFVVNEY